MTSSAPIGVFDSGLGGLSVVRRMRREMPNENIIFYADCSNAPYGTKSVEQVRLLSCSAAERLIKQGAKALVVACNTATSAAAEQMREKYSLPVIGMEPALKTACEAENTAEKPENAPDAETSGRTVIVAATELTLREEKFARLMKRFEDRHTIYRQPCPDFVTIAENGQLNDAKIADKAIHRYFDKYDLSKTDSIVLGCTHFVFFRDAFRRVIPKHVKLIDGNEGTVRHLKNVLKAADKEADKDTVGTVRIEGSFADVEQKRLAFELLGETPETVTPL
ncbi:MAG: glutamate racemase [Bifidobacteriaceae bacterium]|nr:glutamate racemase [Bifidobacteriaceae bacterium]